MLEPGGPGRASVPGLAPGAVSAEPAGASGPEGRISAVDGLRGVAVALVVAFHYGLGLPGGFLGVDLFFVISGFVITRLLLAGRGLDRASLARFWFRRAKRLLPALFLVVAGVQAWMVVQNPPGLRSTANAQTLAALTYTSNWYAIVGHVGYWDVSQSSAPLNHLWSLAIEEQFYLVWPLLLAVFLGVAARRGVERPLRRLAVLAIGIAAVCYLLAAVFYEPGSYDRAYMGTDTRAGALLLGAVVACRPVSRRLVGAGPALAALLLLWGFARIDSGAFYTWQLPLAGVAAALLINAIAHHGEERADNRIVARVLENRPVMWVGRRSYGIYLWHWPVWVFLGVDYPGLSHTEAVALALGLSLVFAMASYRLVEFPVRYGTVRARIALPVFASCFAVLAILAYLPVANPLDATNGPIVSGPHVVKP